MIDGGLTIGVAVIAAAVFVSAGVWYVRRLRLTVEDYIVARNTAGPGIATATLVASVIGAWVLFSPGETGTWAGLVALIGYGIGQAAPLVAFVFVGPRMRRLMPEGHSLTEFVYYRYGRYMYVFVLAVLLFYMFIFLSAELTGIALALNLLGDTPLALTALIVGVLTVAYTAYGGIRASIFTDSIQFVLILPLLLIAFVAAAVAMDGFGTALDVVRDTRPELLSLTHGAGIEFGIVLIIAILSANMFHQGFWQRVYTVRDDAALKRGFAVAGAIVIPLILLAGFLGIMAVGQGVVGDTPSVALFSAGASRPAHLGGRGRPGAGVGAGHEQHGHFAQRHRQHGHLGPGAIQAGLRRAVAAALVARRDGRADRSGDFHRVARATACFIYSLSRTWSRPRRCSRPSGACTRAGSPGRWPL